MSLFKGDLEKEQLLGKFLDQEYKKRNWNFQRINDVDLQHRGVDLILRRNENIYYIDEKAQLHYINSSLPTFTFELSYLKNGNFRKGWLFDNNKLTTHYFLVTSINAHDKTNLHKGFKNCKILMVNREKLISHLSKLELSELQLEEYDRRIRKSNLKGPMNLSELNSTTEGCIHFSSQLKEKPMNLKLYLSFIVSTGAGTVII